VVKLNVRDRESIKRPSAAFASWSRGAALRRKCGGASITKKPSETRRRARLRAERRARRTRLFGP